MSRIKKMNYCGIFSRSPKESTDKRKVPVKVLFCTVQGSSSRKDRTTPISSFCTRLGLLRICFIYC